MNLRFRALHLTANGNFVLEPLNHKEAIGRKTSLTLNGRKAAEIFDTIASVESPLYLAKPIINIKIEENSILQGEFKK